MPVTQFFNPFGTQQHARDLDSQIDARSTRTALDLFSMQQAMDEKKNQMAYLQERADQMAARQRQTPQAGQPTAQGQQGQQQPKPGAADMILNEVQELDAAAALAGKYNLSGEVDKLTKLREQAMGRYSLAKEREVQDRDRQEKMQKERIAAAGRFASGANAILSDDTMDPTAKRVALEAMEDTYRTDNPEAYKVLAMGAPKIDWGDPRTWARMKGVQESAISPEKRAELGISKARLDEQKRRDDEQKRRDDIYNKRVDALIAASREKGSDSETGKPPAGMRWANKEHTEIEPIPVKSATSGVSKDVHGQAYLDALPEDDQGLIRGIAEGRIDPKTLSTRGGHREEILKKVAQYRPDWNQAKFSVYQAVQKDFTSGVAARNVTAINTAIAHMGTLYDAGEALKSGDIQKVNQFVNAVRTQTGDPRVNNFDVASSAVANELMRVFRQVGASESETKDWEKKFNAAQSPEQKQGALKVGAKLLEGRIEAVDDQWKRGMDSKEGYPNLLSPKSSTALRKLGVKIDRGEQKQADGKKGGAMSLEDYLSSKEGK